MDLESLGSGAATGFISTVLTLLGWNRRIVKLEEDKVDRSVVQALRDELLTVKADTREDYRETKAELTYLKHRIDAIYEKVMAK